MRPKQADYFLCRDSYPGALVLRPVTVGNLLEPSPKFGAELFGLVNDHRFELQRRQQRGKEQAERLGFFLGATPGRFVGCVAQCVLSGHRAFPSIADDDGFHRTSSFCCSPGAPAPGLVLGCWGSAGAEEISGTGDKTIRRLQSSRVWASAQLTAKCRRQSPWRKGRATRSADCHRAIDPAGKQQTS